jgi:hypothetical protein
MTNAERELQRSRDERDAKAAAVAERERLLSAQRAEYHEILGEPVPGCVIHCYHMGGGIDIEPLPNPEWGGRLQWMAHYHGSIVSGRPFLEAHHRYIVDWLRAEATPDA